MNTPNLINDCPATFKPVIEKAVPVYVEHFRKNIVEIENQKKFDDKVIERVLSDLKGMKGEKGARLRDVEQEWMRKNNTDKLNMHYNSVKGRTDKVNKIMEKKYGKKLASYIDRHLSTWYDNRNTIYKLLLDRESKIEAERREEARLEEERWQEAQRNKMRDEFKNHNWYLNIRNSNTRGNRSRYASSGLGGYNPPDLKSTIRKISDGEIEYTKKPESTNTEKYRKREYAEKHSRDEVK